MQIIYTQIPKNLKNTLSNFFFDDYIKVPVQKTAKDKDVSWEMIISAILKVISASSENLPDSKTVNYYRNLTLAVKPDIFNELNTAAIVKARNRDYELALEIIDALEGLFPENKILLLNKALILEPKYEKKALEAYESLLAMDNVIPEALYNAGFFFLNRKDYVRVVECFTDYLARTGRTKENEEKRKYMRNIIKDIEKRGLGDSDFALALDFIRRGNANEGLLNIKKFLERRPLVWNGWFVLGWALRLLGRWNDSIEAYKKAVELGGKNSDTQNEMAICYIELDDLKSAQKELESALCEDPENIKIISNLGVIASKSGDTDLAHRYFKTVLELDPDDIIAKNFIGQE